MTTSEVLNLVELLNNPDWQVRNSIAQTLLNQGQRIVPILLQSLLTTEVIVRDEIIHILGELADERSVPILVTFLGADDRLLVHRTVMALLAFKQGDILDLLLAKLHTFPANTVMHVIKQVGLQNHRAAIPMLMDLVAITPSDNYRFMAIRALVALEATEAQDLIAQYLDAEDYYVRESAEMGIEQLSQLTQ